MHTEEKIITAQSLFKELKNYSVYEFFRANSEQYGTEYAAFQHYGRDHKKSEFINDIEALSYYYQNDLGFKAGDVYTVFMPTSVEAMIIFMALNKIGVIVNFVHPLLPPENVKEIMEETNSKGIAALDLLLKDHIGMLAQKGIPCLITMGATYAVPDKFSVKPHEGIKAALDAYVKNYAVYNEIIAKYSGNVSVPFENNENGIAVYMNGGGTTGKSRTIKLSNAAINNVVNMCCMINRRLEEPGIDTEIASMPFFHAYGFCVGGLSGLHKASKMVFLPKFDADTFIEILKREKVSEFNGVPNAFKKLYAHPEFDGPFLKNIRAMFCGGDNLHKSFLKEFRAVLRKNGCTADIYQGYGLTECGAICTVNPVWANKEGTIGKPLPGNTIEIWDDNDNNLPIGEIGEVVINGPTMMEGYLTQDGPIDDGVYKDANGKKWIKTGDLAHYDEDGYLHFIGRKKRVIIISGYNVYPGDIEFLMNELPFIRECCAVQGVQDDKIIVRLYVAADNLEGNEEAYKEQITQLCAERLSKFSVPRDIRFIDALPRTRIEKVDFMSLTEFPSIK